MQNIWQEMIGRQLAAAIQMIRSAIEACPDPLWDDRSEGSPFWHLAYHALFFIDFYLSRDSKTFQAMNFHIQNSELLPGDYKEFAGIIKTPDSIFSKSQLMEYADHCLIKSNETFERLTNERALERCGFWWYELNVGEFLLNNLRHAQHHAGQLILILRRRAGIGIDWMGTKDNCPPDPTW